MTKAEMIAKCNDAIANGEHVTFTCNCGQLPDGFPVGIFVQELPDKRHVY